MSGVCCFKYQVNISFHYLLWLLHCNCVCFSLQYHRIAPQNSLIAVQNPVQIMKTNIDLVLTRIYVVIILCVLLLITYSPKFQKISGCKTYR